MTWDIELEHRLRARWGTPAIDMPAESARGPVVWTEGDLVAAEVAGHLVLTTPAKTFSLAEDLPPELAAAWQEKSTSNPYFQWVQGRFVEAEQANLNGAFWSTGDLEFGEMGVAHGPLNWLHWERWVVGTIADAKLIRPTGDNKVERPYIAATAAMWKWLYPDEANEVQTASDAGKLYYSMECVAEQIQCTGLNGCGQSFEYLKAMMGGACQHINERSSTRRMVNPSFLGGAVIVPPVRPGWSNANAEVIRSAAALAEQASAANLHGLTAVEWEGLMANVLRLADAE